METEKQILKLAYELMDLLDERMETEIDLVGEIIDILEKRLDNKEDLK